MSAPSAENDAGGCPRCFIENKPCARHCDPATCPDPAHVTREAIFVPLTDCWWEPTDDPKFYRRVEPCDEGCHHPVHAWHPERRRHLEDAEWLRANAERRTLDPEP